jgi:hypothetical protein
MQRKDSVAVLRALTGQRDFDLSMIGIDLGTTGGGGPVCGEGGLCPEIACRIEPVPGVLAKIMFSADSKKRICAGLAEYEGRPHPEAAPDAKIIRELLIRDLQKREPEFVRLTAVGNTAMREFSLAGVEVGTDLLLSPKFVKAVRDVDLHGCSGDPESRLICDVSIEVETPVTHPTMIEGLPRELMSLLYYPARDARERLVLTREGERWSLSLDEGQVERIFGNPPDAH